MTTFQPTSGQTALLGLLCLGALLCGCANTPAIDEPPETGPTGEWPQWRGPNRDGKVEATGLLPSWGRGEPRQIWRRELGSGFASIAVAGDQVFSLFGDGEDEILVALSARDGSERWRATVGKTFRESHGNGPRTTPAIAGNTVYALGSHGRLIAVGETDGELRWADQLDEPPAWGFSSSPLVEGDLVIIHAQWEQTTVQAFDRATGAVAWTAGSGHPGYSSPLAVTLHGERQVISFVGSGLSGLDPASGEQRWSHPWATSYSVNAADPIFLPPDRFFISSGYDTGASLLQIRQAESGFEAEELWSTRQMKNHFSSSVQVGDHIFGFDNATLKCLVVETGETCWRKRGFGKGSLIVAGNHLLVLGDEGTLALVEPTAEEYREHGRTKALTEGGWAPPVLAGDWLYARDAHEIVCLNLEDRGAG